MNFKEFQNTRSEFRKLDIDGFWGTETGFAYVEESYGIECSSPDGPFYVTIGNDDQEFLKLEDAEKHLYDWLAGEMHW